MDIKTLSKLMKVNSTITISQAKMIEQILHSYNVNEGNIIVKQKIKPKRHKKHNKKQIVMRRKKR